MTDLNPTPNAKLAVRGLLGAGDVLLGVVLAVVGYATDIGPLIWVGVALLLCGLTMTAVTSRSKRSGTPE